LGLDVIVLELHAIPWRVLGCQIKQRVNINFATYRESENLLEIGIRRYWLIP